MSELDTAFVLAPDVVAKVARLLSREDRERINCAADDTLLIKQRSRARAKVLKEDAYHFALQFREPVTLLDAVERWAEQSGADREETLEQFFPVIDSLIRERYLVPTNAREHSPSAPSFITGSSLEDFEISVCIHVYEDCELYRVRLRDGSAGAMKIARASDPKLNRKIENERNLLGAVGHACVPALLRSGMIEGRAYFVMAWLDGEPVAVVADRLRREKADPRRELLELCHRVVLALAQVHASGIVHADIHPLNLLAEDDGQVRVLDFGSARRLVYGSEEQPQRGGGVEFFFEPELASAHIDGAALPPPTTQSDQYALAALLYLLFTGDTYLELSYDKEEALRQIRDLPPRPFSALGVAPWPDLERVLATALAKDPSGRFESLEDFAEALASVEIADAVPLPGGAVARSSAMKLIVDTFVADATFRSDIASRVATGASFCSVHTGASGLAYALYRIACLGGGATLLDSAELWSAWAMRHRGDAEAYFDFASGIREETVGTSSVTYSACGTALVDALVGLTVGNHAAAQRSVELYVTLAERPCEERDVFLGRAGLLLGCCLLLDAARPASAILDLNGLDELAGRLHDGLQAELDAEPAIGSGEGFRRLGAAHGWSGVLYALMRWAELKRRAPPADLAAWLQQLSRSALPAASGIRWPAEEGVAGDRRAGEWMFGWCNGGAGHVHTWLLAHKLLRDETYLDLAVRSARQSMADTLDDETPGLCCGATGVGFALLELYKATGEREWLDHAFTLAVHAAEHSRSPVLRNDGLFRGACGVAVLAASVQAPERSTMPIFGREI